ncbi:hypothetical protein MKK88_27030 [Methylobacterium sp. E-005]|uniref:hypothetical protein n=1 Tax=Methylobacterium sp. E-005 TaxID=2836549 RepID=UPI001FB93B64|nr:hypothetical protein [Methylobacterium sp. E-005]MCJ2089610.1 hypothetical protein [Methylobacterium sp. E-005]
MIDDAELEIAVAIRPLRKPAIERDFGICVVGIPDDPEVAACDLGRLDAHLGACGRRPGCPNGSDPADGVALARCAHDNIHDHLSGHHAAQVWLSNNPAETPQVENGGFQEVITGIRLSRPAAAGTCDTRAHLRLRRPGVAGVPVPIIPSRSVEVARALCNA